eukprot:3418154-Rhodomonas_salina.1
MLRDVVGTAGTKPSALCLEHLARRIRTSPPEVRVQALEILGSSGELGEAFDRRPAWGEFGEFLTVEITKLRSLMEEPAREVATVADSAGVALAFVTSDETLTSTVRTAVLRGFLKETPPDPVLSVFKSALGWSATIKKFSKPEGLAEVRRRLRELMGGPAAPIEIHDPSLVTRGAMKGVAGLVRLADEGPEERHLALG